MTREEPWPITEQLVPVAIEERQESGEVVRVGRCPDHPRRRFRRFLGVNAKGWVFKCSEVPGGHYFVNAAPTAPGETGER